MTLLKPSRAVVSMSSELVIVPLLKYRQASRNLLPDEVDWVSTCSRFLGSYYMGLPHNHPREGFPRSSGG